MIARSRISRLLRARLSACAGSLAFMLVGSSQAAEFIVLEDECNGQQLLIQGLIEPGDADRFSSRFAALVTSDTLPSVQDPELLWTVKLDSPGGDLQEAIMIGRRVRELLVTTEVSFRFVQRPDGVYDFDRRTDPVCLSGDDRLAGCSPSVTVADCTGACLLIWLAGADRRAIEGRLGNHGLASGGEAVADYLSDMEIDEAWIKRLTDIGTDKGPSGISEAAAITFSGDGWLDWTGKGDLSGRAPALDTLLADCPEPLSAAQAIESVMTESPEHRASLLNRNEAYWDCRNIRVGGVRAGISQPPITTASLSSRTFDSAAALSNQEAP